MAGVELEHCDLISRRVRRLLKTSAPPHAGYAAMADNELGAGVLPTRAHLAIDATIGARLMAAGLTLRNEPDPALVLLVSMGLTKLLLTSLLERGRITGAPAPHDRALSVSTAS